MSNAQSSLISSPRSSPGCQMLLQTSSDVAYKFRTIAKELKHQTPDLNETGHDELNSTCGKSVQPTDTHAPTLSGRFVWGAYWSSAIWETRLLVNISPQGYRPWLRDFFRELFYRSGHYCELRRMSLQSTYTRSNRSILGRQVPRLNIQIQNQNNVLVDGVACNRGTSSDLLSCPSTF